MTWKHQKKKVTSPLIWEHSLFLLLLLLLLFRQSEDSPSISITLFVFLCYLILSDLFLSLLNSFIVFLHLTRISLNNTFSLRFKFEFYHQLLPVPPKYFLILCKNSSWISAIDENEFFIFFPLMMNVMKDHSVMML